HHSTFYYTRIEHLFPSKKPNICRRIFAYSKQRGLFDRFIFKGGMRVEIAFVRSLLACFFIAAGVMIGGTLIGSLAAFFSGESPFAAMIRIAHASKIWAIVAAIGGTFDAIENFQKGVLDGSTEQLIKQVCLVI